MMTWTRLDDSFTDLPDLAPLDHATRWHYLSLVQFCSRTARYDGRMPLVDALRASDHPEPATALTALGAAGLIVFVGREVTLPRIADHVPPPSMRVMSTERVHRKRAHDAGDHSLCLPKARCKRDETRSETRSETRFPGTGQDGTGQDTQVGTRASAPEAAPVTEWETAPIPNGTEEPCTDCRVCGQELWAPISRKSCVCDKRDDAHREARAAV
jgi:hypothetical protein